MLNNKIYNYQKESEFQNNTIDNNNNDKYYRYSYYLSSLDFLKDNMNKLNSKIKLILNIYDKKDNKELLNIIESVIDREKSNEILKQNKVHYIDINKITNEKKSRIIFIVF